MKREIAEKWVALLESGEFQQGTRRLRTGDNRCCLGVLCDLYQRETGRGSWREAVWGLPSFAFEEVEDASAQGSTPVGAIMYPHRAVREWAGLRDASGDFVVDGVKYCLSYYNDHGKSFTEIAAIIRDNVDRL